MHSYTIDSKEREIIPLYFGLISILLTWITSKYILQPISDVYSVPTWWIDTPAVVGFYNICYKVFDLYLWKFKHIRNLLGVKIPDLRGQ